MPGQNDASGERRHRLADLRRGGGAEVDYRPDRASLADLAADLGLPGLSKVRLAGRIRPASGGWDLDGHVGATLEQTCVATLVPVRTRIDQPVRRAWRTDIGEPAPGSETEMPEDDSLEPLADPIDLHEVLREEIALAMPAFPRAAGADSVARAVTEPGRAPLSDADVKPFAGLSALRDRLGGADEEPG